ncbi:hypothetical protein HYALB_00005952 [Hymenoscyphus albidus]|uniref:Uncharacterized protein n=1 Tax=Hymenoscyphus albidus TaxID=595503 RepID=A0A9N9LFD8_9HELO|nr:hypothetical protein HYALB_00005952 [Hymenoscyphus albidus]
MPSINEQPTQVTEQMTIETPTIETAQPSPCAEVKKQAATAAAAAAKNHAAKPLAFLGLKFLQTKNTPSITSIP